MRQALPLVPAAWLRQAGFVLLAMALLLAVLAQYSGLDLALADSSFDPAARRFPWRDLWFADGFMHRWVKLPLIVLGSVLVLTAASEAALHWPRLERADRWRLRAAAAVALLVPLVISLLKRRSASHCPWSLERYGGDADECARCKAPSGP